MKIREHCTDALAFVLMLRDSVQRSMNIATAMQMFEQTEIPYKERC